MQGVVAILALIGVRLLVASAQDAAAARSTIAGVYANDQADRGQVVYDAKCQSCHGSALEGGTLAPVLKGSEFLSSFQGKPLRRIYSRIISTMPPDDVGSLTENETLALVALVLRSNGYPAGAEALARADDLNEIVVAPPTGKPHQGMWNAEAAAFRRAGFQACLQPPGSSPPQRGCRVGDNGPEGLRYPSLRSRSVR
jgi:S-disulfanyl-L-cysteine oxidoreductase SoxD